MPWLSGDPYRHHAPPFPDPEAVWRLRRLVREFRPDVVHAYGWITGSATMALLGKKVPLLVSAHDYGNVCSVFTLVRRGVEPCSGPGPRKCLDCASHNYGFAKGAVTVSSVYACRPLIRRKMSRMHTVSGFVTEFMERTIEVPAEEIATIPNFLQDDQGVEPDGAILERLPREPFIMFVGHLRPYKGLPQLLEAYGSLTDPPPLVLVGTKGPDTPESFPEGVTVLTYVPHATVMAMWERALFAVSPSLAPETGPIVAQEAMSKGRAVIGVRAAGYRYLIEDETTGLLVPPGDVPALREAMARLIVDGELRERLGAGAKEAARSFSAGAVLPRFEALYRETAAGVGEAGP